MMQKNIQYEFWIPILVFVSLISISLLFSFIPLKKKIPNTQKHEHIVFENISLNYITQGKTKWSIKSRNLKLDKEKLIAIFQDSTILAKHPISETNLLRIKSPHTHYDIKKQKLFTKKSQTELLYLNEPTLIQSNYLIWNLEKNHLSSKDYVSILYQNFKLSGNYFFMDLNKKDFVIKKNFKIKTIPLHQQKPKESLPRNTN